MHLNDHQKRLWQHMIDLIDDFLNEKNNDFVMLVGSLEGALDAAGIANHALIKNWYDFWAPLEMRCAIEGNQVNKEKATQELCSMRNFLIHVQ